ncbi:hypothetical protein [Glaciimonas immobilis]|uniref:Uncharacterized protein n=1 Tax=Glaciimonas immobilis TaxID=728004 RepID=A0A840RSH8_9BURK|nr:hypothetical protein [Glaciimonas immobilis]KAF3997558.1 hypothetical protein HAV38_12840 [Glaciimonas immobilis]MBB5200755.1 hypothetical protein [Glaciimonas immobilis]
MLPRLKMFFIWLLCLVVTPIMIIAMLAQTLFGSILRAKSMAVSLDECGNCLFGGDPQETISRRTGMALIAGKRWAKIAAPFIDLLFGKGHCLANAAATPLSNNQGK